MYATDTRLVIGRRFVNAACLMLAATTAFAAEFEWFAGGGMGWPAAPDFIYLDGTRIEREDITHDGRIEIVNLGESYGARGGVTITGAPWTLSVSITNGAFFPSVVINEWNDALPEDLLPIEWSTQYREFPNFLSACLDALVGVDLPLGRRVSVRPSLGGAVVADAYYLVKARTVSENVNEDLVITAPREIRWAYGGAAELGLLIRGRKARSLEFSYRQFFFAPVDFTHPEGTLTTWFPAFQVYVGFRSSSQ